jgi:hypothetical protein
MVVMLYFWGMVMRKKSLHVQYTHNFFYSTGDWTQDLVLARQLLCHFSHTLNPLAYQSICLGPASDHDSPTSTSLVTGHWCALPHQAPDTVFEKKYF